MYKHSQYSIFDSLIDLIPDIRIRSRDGISSKAANTVYEIWKNSDLKIGERMYKRPVSLAKDKLDLAQKEGLIRRIGQEIEITDKGENVLKVMVLGDDNSSFDRNASDPDYMTAISKLPQRTANTKLASNQWWERFVD